MLSVLKTEVPRLLTVARSMADPWVNYAKSRNDPLIPPPWLHNIGGGNFRAVGTEFLGLFVDLCDLKPTEQILDVGSGTGRMATALVDYLTTGTFDGLEIVKRSVDWCNQAYAPYPNFRFHHADVKNDRYNPSGQYKASEYRFPFDDGSFDFVFLASVFTHMLPDDVQNYGNEIHRVLAPGGRALVTAYLLNGPRPEFPRKGDGFYYNGRTAEGAVAYDEDHFLKMVGGNSVHPGSWRGPQGTSWQDIVLIR